MLLVRDGVTVNAFAHNLYIFIHMFIHCVSISESCSLHLYPAHAVRARYILSGLVSILYISVYMYVDKKKV